MLRILFFLCLLIITIISSAFAEEPTRYEVEAAFVYKFIKFVNWPYGELEKIEEISLCYLGSGEIEGPLHKLDGYEVKNKKIRIRKHNNIEQILTCQILFIDMPRKANRKVYMDQLKNESILTISHFNGFIEEGGMINLFLTGNKVNFEINFNSTKNSNLKVSSKLLKLAKRIIAEN